MFWKVDSIKNLKKIIKICQREEIPFRVIGNGSNILFSDDMFKGLVICFGNDFSRIKKSKNKFKCQSGALLSKLVIESVSQGFGGMEKLIGIPGSIGGALYGNAGCNDTTISDCLESVLCLINGKVKRLKKSALNYGYRTSMFKQNANIIILEATFKLEKADKEKTLMIMKKELQIRKEKQPKYPNIGCIFKNGDTYNAGKIIEECGLKGLSVNGVRVSEVHANMIENFNNGSANDVKELIKIIKERVFHDKNISLEEEIIIW